jgi:hypothetical protein
MINPYAFVAAGGGLTPTLRAQGGVNSPSIGTLVLPAGWQIGDLHLMVLETANETVTTPSGWTALTNSPQGTGTAASSTASMISIFYRWAQSGDADVSIANIYNHCIGFIIGFYNVNVTTPFDVSPSGDIEASTTTAVTYPAITTATNGCLVLYTVSSMIDTSTAQITAATFSGLSNQLGPYGGSLTFGNGGGVYMFSGEMATAGSTGTGTSTAVTATVQGRITLALRPS